MKLRELFWKPVAWIASRKPVFNYLRKRAMKTPYFHLPGYMNRYWLWNPYDHDTHKSIAWWGRFFPSIRIHHILRADVARHLHDHPWNARTIIGEGYYVERIFAPGFPDPVDGFERYKYNTRVRGNTARILFEQYHSIDEVSPGGVWTIFITYKYKGNWGFMVNGTKMPWREYEEKYPT